MTEYNIKLSKGHILIDNGEGWLLVDTGSPLSCHEAGRIDLDGGHFSVPTSIPIYNVDANYLSEKIGERVRGLVGMDILGRTHVKIDLPGGKMTFGCSTEGMRRTPSSIGLMGYVSVDMNVNGRQARLILDTGAPISYVFPSITEGVEAVDRVTDFHPSIFGGNDSFETPIFEFPASFAGNDFTMRAGHLPLALRLELGLLGASGVIGLELFRRFPIAIADGFVWV